MRPPWNSPQPSPDVEPAALSAPIRLPSKDAVQWSVPEGVVGAGSSTNQKLEMRIVSPDADRSTRGAIRVVGLPSVALVGSFTVSGMELTTEAVATSTT